MQFLIVSHSQQNVPGNDPCFLVITSSVSCQFQNLRRQILHNGRLINWSTRCDAIMVCGLPEVSMNPADWKLKPSFRRARDCLSSFCCLPSSSRHIDVTSGTVLLQSHTEFALVEGKVNVLCDHCPSTGELTNQEPEIKQLVLPYLEQRASVIKRGVCCEQRNHLNKISL